MFVEWMGNEDCDVSDINDSWTEALMNLDNDSYLGDNAESLSDEMKKDTRGVH